MIIQILLYKGWCLPSDCMMMNIIISLISLIDSTPIVLPRKQARKLQDAQADKLKSSTQDKLTS